MMRPVSQSARRIFAAAAALLGLVVIIVLFDSRARMPDGESPAPIRFTAGFEATPEPEDRCSRSSFRDPSELAFAEPDPTSRRAPVSTKPSRASSPPQKAPTRGAATNPDGQYRMLVPQLRHRSLSIPWSGAITHASRAVPSTSDAASGRRLAGLRADGRLRLLSGYQLASSTGELRRRIGSPRIPTPSPRRRRSRRCIARTCAGLRAECGTVPDGCDGRLDVESANRYHAVAAGAIAAVTTRARLAPVQTLVPAVAKSLMAVGAPCNAGTARPTKLVVVVARAKMWLHACVVSRARRAVRLDLRRVRHDARLRNLYPGGDDLRRQRVVPNKCGCAKTTCEAQNANCGMLPDGCGARSIAKGARPPKCVAVVGQSLWRPACVAKTCAQLGAECGPVSDGCGKVLDCGNTCQAPRTCGGGGTPNHCGCKPTTCLMQGKNCGTILRRCGAMLDCGKCTAPSTCAGAGEANVCGCTPKTCAPFGAQCGLADDGCGGKLDCGTCAAPSTCAANGTPNKCECKPTTCAAQGAMCGAIPDRCGKTLMCGMCKPLEVCGALTPNQCGLGVCIPKTCAALGLDCGDAQDGCGHTLHCGTCAMPKVCGGSGVANHCGCRAKSCDAVNADCGMADDGCGTMIDCGTCKSPKVCGQQAREPVRQSPWLQRDVAVLLRRVLSRLSLQHLERAARAACAACAGG